MEVHFGLLLLGHKFHLGDVDRQTLIHHSISPPPTPSMYINPLYSIDMCAICWFGWDK